MKRHLYRLIALFLVGLAGLLILNGFQRIGYYGDWPGGFHNLGVGCCLGLLITLKME